MAKIDPYSVFLNVPYDSRYSPLFITLVTTLLCLGHTPRVVIEIPEHGAGRLNRIFELLRSCSVSFHDLSRVGTPSRFNMPFELGLAQGLSFLGIRHDVVVFDAVPYRLDRLLSDYKGRDPLIHHNRCDSMVTCIVDVVAAANQPSTRELCAASRILRGSAREICKRFGCETIFRRTAYKALVAAALEHAKSRGFILERNLATRP